MRAGRYQTPGYYQAPEEQYGPSNTYPTYPDMAMDLLNGDQHYGLPEQQAIPMYPALDQNNSHLPKQLSLNSYGSIWEGGEEDFTNYGGFGGSGPRPRHGRSVSLSGENGAFGFHTPERRLRPSYPGSGGYNARRQNLQNPQQPQPFGPRPPMQVELSYQVPSGAAPPDPESFYFLFCLCFLLPCHYSPLPSLSFALFILYSPHLSLLSLLCLSCPVLPDCCPHLSLLPMLALLSSAISCCSLGALKMRDDNYVSEEDSLHRTKRCTISLSPRSANTNPIKWALFHVPWHLPLMLYPIHPISLMPLSALVSASSHLQADKLWA